jgi:hypothetical protein
MDEPYAYKATLKVGFPPTAGKPSTLEREREDPEIIQEYLEMVGKEDSENDSENDSESDSEELPLEFIRKNPT